MQVRLSKLFVPAARMIPTVTRNLVAGALVTGALGVVAFGVLTRPDDRAGPCGVAHAAQVPEIPEASGLAVSRRHRGIVWSHNDSGHTAMLFALDATGRLRGRVRVPVRTRDWEDVSAARCPAGDCLYIADIGDNRGNRQRIHVYRVPEPALDADETAPPEVFTASYADGAHNAEALFLIGEDIFVVTRERTTAIYRAALPRSGALDLTLHRVGEFGLGPVTDAEASPDERWVVVRTSKVVAFYRVSEMLRGGAVRDELRFDIEGLKEPQGEGAALGADGVVYLASEGRPWNRAGRFISLRCTLP